MVTKDAGVREHRHSNAAHRIQTSKPGFQGIVAGPLYVARAGPQDSGMQLLVTWSSLALVSSLHIRAGKCIVRGVAGC